MAHDNTAMAVNGIPTLAEVCQSPDDFLAKLDVGLLNLMCAGGLPGAENLDIAKLLDWLDVAADAVSDETRRRWYRFLESPGAFGHSPGYFCCYFMLQVLQEDFAVKYNPARIRDSSFQDPKCFDPDFQDSRDLFIHGIIDGPGGTCASMPVLYVAVGKRLGYPVRLVETRGHLFFRWDDPGGERFGIPELFNIEGAGSGIGSYPDDYYRTWPDAWTEQDKAGGFYLKSLSPTEELAAFLCTRGECLTDNGSLAEAIQAYEWAVGLLPDDPRYRTQLIKLHRRNQQRLVDLQDMLEVQREAQQLRLDGPHRLEPTLAPHGDYCQCVHCRKAREPKPGLPGHPAGCPCFHCRQAQDLNQRQGAPGHPPGCGCFHCQQSKSRPNPFSPW